MHTYANLPPILHIAGSIDASAPLYPSPPSDPTHKPPAIIPDPIPNPEPASPSLDEPDPGVFRHSPTRPSN